ncbi:MAG: molybdopterin dinucleotide binding domain-containing protein, partial [Haloarculaceae archaeon]
NKCILCNRCVEACNDVQVAGVLRMEDSGNETHIGFQKSGAETWDESTCISCGHCVTVCPTGSLVEKRGTFTNTERRIQLVNPILSPPGGARTDMDILQDLAGRMGFEWDYDGPADVMEEISDLTPIYGGVTHERLEARGDGLQWPVWDEDHPGTPYLYDEAFNTDDGKAHFVPADFGEPPQLPSEEFPLTLTTGRVLYHWHTGSMTRRVEALMDQVGESFVEIHPETAAQLGVSDDEYVRVSSENGSIVVKANVTDRVDRRTVFIPMHFVHGAVNRLTMDELDPTSFIPDYKVTSVAVAPLGPDPDAEPLPAPTPGDD